MEAGHRRVNRYDNVAGRDCLAHVKNWVQFSAPNKQAWRCGYTLGVRRESKEAIRVALIFILSHRGCEARQATEAGDSGRQWRKCSNKALARAFDPST